MPRLCLLSTPRWPPPRLSRAPGLPRLSRAPGLPRLSRAPGLPRLLHPPGGRALRPCMESAHASANAVRAPAAPVTAPRATRVRRYELAAAAP
eukprot:355211-Chlamydomonas_euryale.AAC.1